MANLIGALADIGEVYLDGEKEIYNEAFKYSNSLKVYLFDIETKELIPNLNIRPEDFVVCRNTKKKADLSSPYLYPVEEIKSNCLKKDKNGVFFLKKTINTFLSYFSDDEIKNNNILSILSNLDDTFFDKCEEKVKEIILDGNYKKNYFALSYQGSPISKLFPQVFETFLNKSEPSTSYGYDILTNVQGVGADPSLLFFSLNEMVEGASTIEPFAKKEKTRRLPLNEISAKKIRLGYEKLNSISCNIDGSEIKMAIIPTVLNKDKEILKKIIKIIEGESKKIKEAKKAKGIALEQAKGIENRVTTFLKRSAEEETANKIEKFIINTLLFYIADKSKMTLVLTIDDVLPSYVSFVSKAMAEHNIHSFYGEGIWKKDDPLEKRALFLLNLFKNNRVENGNGNQKTQNQLKVMEFLFSRRKIKTGDIIRLYAEAIVNNGNRPFLWTDYFNDFYNNKDSFPVPAIERLHLFFNEIEILTEIINIGRKKMKDFTEEELLSIVQSSEFLKQSSLHQAAYLLGILSQAIYRWQQNVRGDYTSQTAFSKFINRNRQITKDKLLEINQECVKTIGKLLSQSEGSRRVDVASSVLLPILSEAVVYNKIVKKEELTLAFAFGGRDFEAYRKLQNQKKAAEKETEKEALPQPNINVVDNAHKQEQSLFNF